MRSSFRFCLALLSCCIFIAPSSHADDRTAGGATPNKAPASKVKKSPPSDHSFDFEGLGLQRASAGGLINETIWQGTKRSDFIALISLLPASTSTPTSQKLLIDVLTTRLDPNVFESDEQPKPGHDLLTLRLQKMIEAGLTSQAFTLYSQIKDDAYHPALIQQGVLAMILSGEKPLACLEVKASIEIFPDDGFLSDMKNYCAISEADIKTVPYDAEQFDALSQLERAQIIADHILSFSADDYKAVSQIAPPHAAALFYLPDITPEQKLMLSMHMHAYRLKDTKDLSQAYKDYYAQSKKPPESTQRLHEFVALYNEALIARDTELWDLLSQALDHAPLYGSESLAPFLPMLKKVTIGENISQDHVQSALEVFHYTGQRPTQNWIKALLRFKPSPQFSFSGSLAIILDKNLKNNKTLVEKIEKSLANTSHSDRNMTKKLLKSLKISINRDNSKKIAYANDLFLTFDENYANFSHNTTERLVNASHDNLSGESILLSLLMSAPNSFKRLEPRTMDIMIQSLNNVGMGSIANDLAGARLIAYKNINKK